MCWFFFFFLYDSATTEIYTYWHTLSLPDALPIVHGAGQSRGEARRRRPPGADAGHRGRRLFAAQLRAGQRRARLLPARVGGLRPRGRTLPELRRAGEAAGAGWPLDLLLLALSKMSRVKDEAGGLCFIAPVARSEEHTSELQSLMRISYAVF